MKNSVDPDQMASLEAIWSGSTVFLKGKGLRSFYLNTFLQMGNFVATYMYMYNFGKNIPLANELLL